MFLSSSMTRAFFMVHASPARGIQKVKVVPWPGWLATAMSPPWASTMSLTMARPRPMVPLASRSENWA